MFSKQVFIHLYWKSFKLAQVWKRICGLHVLASKKRLKPNFNSEGLIFVPFFDDLSLRLESEIDGVTGCYMSDQSW